MGSGHLVKWKKYSKNVLKYGQNALKVHLHRRSVTGKTPILATVVLPLTLAPWAACQQIGLLLLVVVSPKGPR